MIPCRVVHGNRLVSFVLNGDPEWVSGWQEGMVYETEVVNAMMAFVQPNDFVVDAGANLGYFTLLLSFLVGEHGKVLAFEPDPSCYPKLMANLEQNNTKNVKVSQTALWSTAESRDFWVLPYCGYSSFLQYHESCPIKVETRTLDSFITGSVPRLIKIDCEGAEGHILAGAENTLRQGVDCVITEFNFAILKEIGVNERDIRGYMHGLGYDFFVLEHGNLPTLVPIEAKIECPGNPAGICFNGMFSTVEKVEKAWA